MDSTHTAFLNLLQSSTADQKNNMLLELLKGYTLTEKKALLISLNKDILDITTNTKPRPNTNLSDFIDYTPNYLKDGDFINKISDEVTSLGLINPENPEKVLTQWISPHEDPYVYGNIPHPSKAIEENPAILNLIENINSNDKTTKNMDACLSGCYTDHTASLRLHSDNEHKQIDQDSSIVIYSLGATRRIDFVAYGSKVPFLSIDLEHNSLLIMKPGAQQLMRHKVDASPSITGPRHFLSLRHSLPRKPAPSVSPVKSLIESFENGATDKPVVPKTSAVLPKSSATHSPRPVKRCTLIAGDSFVARLDPVRLGKGKTTVHNISKRGAKISQVEQSIDNFYMTDSDSIVEKVFLCVATNDIRNCYHNGVKHLKSPLIQLIRKVKLLFPKACVYFQSLIPLPVRNQTTIKNIMDTNYMIFDICKKERIYYLNVFWAFLGHDGYRNKNLFPKNLNDIHPNKIGVGTLARFYIERIHSKRFNPLGY